MIGFLNCPIRNYPIANCPSKRISGKYDFFKPITSEEIVIFMISFKILSLDKFSLRTNNLLYTEFMDLMILDYETINGRETLYGAFARSSV